MIFKETLLKDCYVLTPSVYSDTRGYFFESFNQSQFEEATKLQIDFIQDNQSMSSIGVLRGLHLQTGKYEQAKLVRVIKGRILDVCVDLRKNSNTFGKHFSVILDDIKNEQLFIPRGMAHGFLVLEEETIFSYKCDNYYNRESEAGIIFNDQKLNIDWGIEIENLILSDKDKNLPTFEAFVNEND